MYVIDILVIRPFLLVVLLNCKRLHIVARLGLRSILVARLYATAYSQYCCMQSMLVTVQVASRKTGVTSF